MSIESFSFSSRRPQKFYQTSFMDFSKESKIEEHGTTFYTLTLNTAQWFCTREKWTMKCFQWMGQWSLLSIWFFAITGGKKQTKKGKECPKRLWRLAVIVAVVCCSILKRIWTCLLLCTSFCRTKTNLSTMVLEY